MFVEGENIEFTWFNQEMRKKIDFVSFFEKTVVSMHNKILSSYL